uniref:Transcription cofactor HES-6 n=1 Tax=Scleropages formosus TaxID=113540 RepID=A0A8C9RVM9_SCLFO
MAPRSGPNKNGYGSSGEDHWGPKGNRKARKPLVEKKRRARINESLQELRSLLADTDAKMENAEVLEMTVRQVEHVIQNRVRADTLSVEASERFAAGYIQCMHEVHMYVSSCPGFDATVAAELLNHLLECMPLNEDHLQDVLVDLMSDALDGRFANGVTSVFSPSTTCSDELSSDLEDTDVEQVRSSHHASEHQAVQNVSTTEYVKSVWRPW